MKTNCTNLYFLSTIACQLETCLTEKELEWLAVNLKALGELLELAFIQQTSCRE